MNTMRINFMHSQDVFDIIWLFLPCTNNVSLRFNFVNQPIHGI
jgi:hypothetical protein